MSYRAQIKSYAKERMSRQFGTVLGGLVLAYLPYYCATAYSAWPSSLMNVTGMLLLPITAISFSLNYVFLFLLPFSSVGSAALSLTAARGQKASCTIPYENGGTQYLRKLGGSCWMFLFVFLWSLLFIIPGIVKAYAYSFTPYILAECPNVKATDALKLSMKMTYGAKGELFVFDLSFIGWWLLTLITFGIVGIYVGPYYSVARASLYDSMKNSALSRGVITEAELNGACI